MLHLWIWLSQCPGLNFRQRLHLVETLGIQGLYNADAQQLLSLNIKPRTLDYLAQKDLAPSQAIMHQCRRLGIQAMSYEDEAYPPSLRKLPNAPLVLYYVGKLPNWNQLLPIGVVGTRSASSQGLLAARRIGSEICQNGGAVVSGMALGVDAMATQGALDAGGTALGILGTGVDIEFPAKNRPLYRLMRSQGCLISEYPPGTPAQRFTFPQRNRIISGLSRGVLVVEASLKSGSMITARDALDQGRDLFTLAPPCSDPMYAGNQTLLTWGAQAIANGREIMDFYGHQQKTLPLDKAPSAPYSVQGLPPLSPQAQSIVEVLSRGPETVDAIIQKTGLSASQALTELTILELQGQICRISGQRVSLT